MATLFYTLTELVDLQKQGKLHSSKINIEEQNRITQTQSNGFRDVHIFDGHLSNPSIPVINDVQNEQALLQKLCEALINPISKQMACRIVEEHGTLDPANKLNPCNILMTILNRRMSIDIFLLLEEQLADIFMLGQCPQGRTTRLIQILEMTI